MAVVNIPGDGLFFNPTGGHTMRRYSFQNTIATLDAAGESSASIGRLNISDKGAAKTLAGAKLWFRNGGSTLTSASTNMRFGIQDVSATGVNDDTFDIYVDILGNSGTLLSNQWQSVTLSTGSKSVSHGDLIAIVVEMTARGATDTFRTSGMSGNLDSIGFPYMAIDSGAGPVKSIAFPMQSFIIEFADGTVGKIDQTFPYSDPDQFLASTTSQTGIYFTAPLTGKMSKVEVSCLDSIAATDNVTITIWEDPLGTRTSLGTYSFLGNYYGATSATNLGTFLLSSEIDLVKDTVYGITLHTTVGSINYSAINLGAGSPTNLKKISPFGENCGYINRSSPFTGGFAANGQYIPSIGFYMSQIDIGSAGAGGGGNFPFG